MRLVIAEKRSVAFAIAQALGGVRQGDGYVSAGGALISWAQGHLVELSDPEEYSDMPWSAHKWTMDSLPIDPKSWRWRLSGAKGAAQRYRSLVELLRSDKVTELVNACDPDREGEGYSVVSSWPRRFPNLHCACGSRHWMSRPSVTRGTVCVPHPITMVWL